MDDISMALVVLFSTLTVLEAPYMFASHSHAHTQMPIRSNVGFRILNHQP